MIIKAGFDKIFLFMSNKKSSNCVSFRYELKDAVDGELLQKAVNITMQRYSYLNVRIIEAMKPYYVENNAPYTVKETNELPKLGSPDTNYHLIAFTYYGKIIRINFFHGMTDGGGIYNIARTLFYYYAKFRYEPNISSEGIITLETPVREGETIDIYEAMVNYDKPLTIRRKSSKKKRSKFFKFTDSKLVKYDSSSGRLIFIKISASEMMAACRPLGMSPSVLAALLLNNSIRKLHPEAEDITCGISISAREALNCPENVRNCMVATGLVFPRKMYELPFNIQCTACRGQVILATDNDIVISIGKELAGAFKFMMKIPYISLTKKLISTLQRIVMNESFQVSYTGRSNLGAAEKYVDALLVEYNMPTKGITLEMTAVGDNMFLCFGQKWKEDVYLNSFLEELHGLGISTEIIEDGPTKEPAMYSTK